MELGLEGMKLTLAAAGASSAGTDVNGAALDMKNFDGVIIFASIATFNAGNFLKAQQGQASNLSDAADLAGSKVAAVANGQVVAIDLFKPAEQFVRGVIVRGGANTITGDMYYLQYNCANKPTSSDVTNVMKTLKLLTPAEGTP